jgi:hypothetical protein
LGPVFFRAYSHTGLTLFALFWSKTVSLRDKCFGLWGVASLSETGRVNEMKDWEAARSTDYLSRRVSFGHFWPFLRIFGPDFGPRVAAIAIPIAS